MYYTFTTNPRAISINILSNYRALHLWHSLANWF